MQYVADDRACRGADHPDQPRREWQLLFARLVEQPLGGKGQPPLFEQGHQGALAGQLQPVDHDLVARSGRICGELAGGDDLDPVLGLEADRGGLASPDHRVDAGAVILQCEIAMAGGDPLEPGNLAAHADMVERALDGALQC